MRVNRCHFLARSLSLALRKLSQLLLFESPMNAANTLCVCFSKLFIVIFILFISCLLNCLSFSSATTHLSRVHCLSHFIQLILGLMVYRHRVVIGIAVVVVHLPLNVLFILFVFFFALVTGSVRHRTLFSFILVVFRSPPV